MITALLAGLASAAGAGPDGRIRVIDGDTFDIGGVRVRLHGIDAPERDQTCLRQDGKRWACGTWAETQVRRAYEGKRATCRAVDRDRYGRIVARCSVQGRDMGADIVREGWATAFLRYSRAYIDEEKEAVVAGRGIFASQMQAPADHRRAAASADAAAPSGCSIKGNISDNGRIYHMPGQEHYARTRINTRQGERWFCSEAEARAAGWRRARR